MPRNDSNPDCEIVLSRDFDAPRELVWKAWTEPEHLAHWWGPQGFTLTTHSRELKAGGSWRYVMHGPDGHNYENISNFIEVVEPERLIYKHGGGKGFEEVNFQVTVTFDVLDARKTRITMRSVFPSKQARDFVIDKYNAVEGGKQTLGRLGEHLQAMQAEGGDATNAPFVATHVFSAPLERVWQAWTERDELMKWFGPKGTEITQCSLDLRPGGTFHYAMLIPSVGVLWGKWAIRKVEAPNNLEFLLSFADELGNTTPSPFDSNSPLETLCSISFAHHAGIGRGTVVRVEASALNASAVQQESFNSSHSGMRQGWGETFERLDESFAGVVSGEIQS